MEIAKVAAKHGGVYASHIRGEGAEVVESVRELIEISERAGLPGEVFHLKVAHRPSWGLLLDSARVLVESTRARGVDVAADMYVYTAGGTGLEATIPSCAFEGGNDSLKTRLANPQTRARLKRELTTGSRGWWNIVEAAGGWGGVVLANAQNPNNTKWVGQTIADIAKARGKNPEDAAHRRQGWASSERAGGENWQVARLQGWTRTQPRAQPPHNSITARPKFPSSLHRQGR